MQVLDSNQKFDAPISSEQATGLRNARSSAFAPVPSRPFLTSAGLDTARKDPGQAPFIGITRLCAAPAPEPDQQPQISGRNWTPHQAGSQNTVWRNRRRQPDPSIPLAPKRATTGQRPEKVQPASKCLKNRQMPEKGSKRAQETRNTHEATTGLRRPKKRGIGRSDASNFHSGGLKLAGFSAFWPIPALIEGGRSHAL